MFLELFQYLIYSIYIYLVKIFGIYQNIIYIYNNKNVNLFSNNLVYIS